jgi:hypothetical protein
MLEAINGKKSYVGLFLYGVGQALLLVGLPDLGEPISKAGELLAGVGVVHKLAKLEG